MTTRSEPAAEATEDPRMVFGERRRGWFLSLLSKGFTVEAAVLRAGVSKNLLRLAPA